MYLVEMKVSLFLLLSFLFNDVYKLFEKNVRAVAFIFALITNTMPIYYLTSQLPSQQTFFAQLRGRDDTMGSYHLN